MPPPARETFRIRDPVHGLIVFGGSGDRHRDETDRIAWRLINTPEFQRLRRIRQLGFSELVFPGATHSRFAHSVGVYHTARRLADVVALRQEDPHDPDGERVALLAALLHDIGHGPFSHVFESVDGAGPRKSHEDWGAEIVRGDTGVNRVLREASEELPDRVAELLKVEIPEDIYASIVSSQFDADRLDYVQRDRLATGVNFAHIDQDWLFDCLDVGSITVGDEEPQEVLCFFLGPKGLEVAEEYLEARFRLYRMVYMHKTTRAAERMLESLLRSAVETMKNDGSTHREPVLRYLTSESPTLGDYIRLDDSAVWSTLAALADEPIRRIADLARRLRDRQLYKCIDVGARDESGANLYRRFRLVLNGLSEEQRREILLDDATVVAYKWYDFDSASALKKVLVRTGPSGSEPRDIVQLSPIVKTLREMRRIERVYVPDRDRENELRKLLEGVENERG